MVHDYYYSFSAIRGSQASRDYYVIMCPLKLLSKIFIFIEGTDLPPHLRAQRIVNQNRIPEITDYIIDNPLEYVFSSITASVDGETQFLSVNDQYPHNGILRIAMDAKMLINDGQHRKLAIQEALLANPELGNETISVVLFIDEGLNRSQQIFSDLNKHAVNISKSIGILYDSRDPLAMLTRELIMTNDRMLSYTDLEQSSLSKYSPKLFTLSNFYSANKHILGKDPISPAIKRYIFDYWYEIISTFQSWKFVFKHEQSAYSHRSESISSYGTTLEALGIVGRQLYVSDLHDVTSKISQLNDIDWKRTHPQWEFRVVNHNGRILKNTKSIRLTAICIKQHLGLSLSEPELELEQEFLSEVHNANQ